MRQSMQREAEKRRKYQGKELFKHCRVEQAQSPASAAPSHVPAHLHSLTLQSRFHLGPESASTFILFVKRRGSFLRVDRKIFIWLFKTRFQPAFI